MTSISLERRVCVAQNRRRVAMPGSMSLPTEAKTDALPSREIVVIIPQIAISVANVKLTLFMDLLHQRHAVDIANPV